VRRHPSDPCASATDRHRGRPALLWEIGSYTIVGPSASEPEGRHDSSGGEEDEDDDNGGDHSAHSSVDAYAQERLLLNGVQKGKFTVTLHGAFLSASRRLVGPLCS
jgi:hypothetical protein